MKHVYTTLIVVFFFASAHGQQFSMGDLVGFTSYPTSKFGTYISRKGFKPKLDAEMPAYYKASKDKTLENLIAKQETNYATTLTFQTNSLAEFNELQGELKDAGYVYGETQTKDGPAATFYQKGNVMVQPLIKEEDGKKAYGFLIERKALPKAKDIVYAEDLLQLNSHEYLVAVYGEANVKKDLFYFSEQEVNKCSVLYPNTNMQVIFIWGDEKNNRNLSFLMIGGHLRAQSSLTYHKQIEQNEWRSAQGIYSGMSLKELVRLNEGHLDFYGWESEQPGFVLNKNKGKVDFKKLGIALQCLDCNEDKFYSNADTLNSAAVLGENRRVYVSAIIVLPPK